MTPSTSTATARAVTDEQRDALRSQLDEMKPLVKNVYYESEQQAFDRFKEQYRNSPLSDYLKVGDIPQNFRVQLSDPKKYEVVVSAFDGAPGVGRVQDQQKTLDKLFKVMNVVTVGSLFLAGLMVLCSILLMATTIRQAAFSRRRETGIMKLVGASNFTIRLPFVMETVLAALAGTSLAIAGLWVTADTCCRGSPRCCRTPRWSGRPTSGSWRPGWSGSCSWCRC